MLMTRCLPLYIREKTNHNKDLQQSKNSLSTTFLVFYDKNKETHAAVKSQRTRIDKLNKMLEYNQWGSTLQYVAANSFWSVMIRHCYANNFWDSLLPRI